MIIGVIIYWSKMYSHSFSEDFYSSNTGSVISYWCSNFEKRKAYYYEEFKRKLNEGINDSKKT